MGVAASTPIVDDLFHIYLAIGTVLALGVFLYLVYLAWRFRARGQPEPLDAPRADQAPPDRGHPAVVFGTVVIVGAILFGLSLSTLASHQFLEHPPADVALTIDVTAFQFGWVFAYPQGFQTIGELRVPANQTILLHLTSVDVMHKFHVPDYRIGIDAIPGRTNALWFKATAPGVAQIRCAELCGVGHARMVGSIAAVARPEFDAWVGQQLATRPDRAFVQVFDLNLTEDGPVPDRLQAVAGGEIHLRLTNHASTPLDFHVEAPYNVTVPALHPATVAWLNFSAPEAATARYGVVDPTGSRAGLPGALRVLASQRITVSLREWKVASTATTVRGDQPVLFTVANDGQLAHDLSVGRWQATPEARDVQGRTPELLPGQGATLAFFPRAPGTLQLWCELAGHSESGMRTNLEVA